MTHVVLLLVTPLNVFGTDHGLMYECVCGLILGLVYDSLMCSSGACYGTCEVVSRSYYVVAIHYHPQC